jgi:hypothetical protein
MYGEAAAESVGDAGAGVGVGVVRESQALVSGKVYQLHPPEVDPAGQYDVDVILLHGLQFEDYTSAWCATWEHTDPRSKEVKCWPADFLHEDLPNVRVLSVSYDSSAFQSPETGNQDLMTLGEQIFTALTQKKPNVGTRPIVLVGHSLGGLALKQLCVYAARGAGNSRLAEVRAKAQNFLANVKGMAFYATPHMGSRLADLAETARSTGINKFKKLVPDGHVMAYLQLLSKDTARLNASFREESLARGWQTIGFYEIHPMTKVRGGED